MPKMFVWEVDIILEVSGVVIKKKKHRIYAIGRGYTSESIRYNYGYTEDVEDIWCIPCISSTTSLLAVIKRVRYEDFVC